MIYKAGKKLPLFKEGNYFSKLSIIKYKRNYENMPQQRRLKETDNKISQEDLRLTAFHDKTGYTKGM